MDYLYIADSDFLNLVSPNFAAKSTRYIQPVTDLARIEAADRLLNQERHEVAIWMDADLLIFRPELLVLPEVDDCAFTREVWLNPRQTADHRLIERRVNNAVSIYRRDGVFLPYYRRACGTIAAAAVEPLPKARIGTVFLTALHQQAPFTLVSNVGNLSPHVLNSLWRGDVAVLAGFAESLGEPLYAVNLSASNLGKDYLGIRNDAEVYASVVSLLLGDDASAVL